MLRQLCVAHVQYYSLRDQSTRKIDQKTFLLKHIWAYLLRNLKALKHLANTFEMLS